MIDSNNAPLLTICIPTYNRSNYLKVMLEALLPQVKSQAKDVEVWILDNASTDQTQAILEECSNLGPYQVKIQPQNVGPNQNIVDGPSKLARGLYTWVLGDHNLLAPNALSRVLKTIKNSLEYEIFYVNYHAASYPQDWPTTAIGGHIGHFDYVGNKSAEEGRVEQWSALLQPHNAICTQNYVHIIKTEHWRQFWKNRQITADYTSAITTYPHTITAIETLFFKPTYVIAEPCITIFNGAQSWNNPHTRLKVYYVGLPDLIHLIEKKKGPFYSSKALWHDFFFPESSRLSKEILKNKGILPGSAIHLRYLGLKPRCWRAFLAALPQICFPNLLRQCRCFVQKLKDYRGWYLFNCRPARWIRNYLSSRNV